MTYRCYGCGRIIEEPGARWCSRLCFIEEDGHPEEEDGYEGE